MAKLTKAEVSHVAKLAKLTLSEKENETYLKQLSKVVEFIGELDKVDTAGLTPTSQTTGLENVYRLDEIKNNNSLSQEEALSGTDKSHNGYFEVGAILNNKSDK